jgi:cobalt-zinc-cadmium resistance protein CzcA
MALIVPITVLAIFLILYTMFRSFKWAMLILVSVVMASVGGPLALFITHTNFSVSSAVGFLALFGVSVQTGVIMIEFINQLRARRKGMEVSTEEHIVEAAVEGAVLRLRPIMMTMLVATLGLLPAALSHAIGSDSQRPFAIVIVGGLIANLVIGVFLLPTLYVCVARSRSQRGLLSHRFETLPPTSPPRGGQNEHRSMSPANSPARDPTQHANPLTCYPAQRG